MTNRPRDIGTWTTTSVIRYLRANGFPGAELRNQAGEHDKGDIVGIIDVGIECKGGKAAENASDLDVERWLAETETERINANAEIGLLVMKRKGIGRERAGQWWVVMPRWTLELLCGYAFADMEDTAPVRMHLADVVTLLRREGYGDPVEDAA